MIVRRYKCLSCAKTFRHYPAGITSKDQSRRTVVLAALMYGLGLSCSATSHLLEVLGVEVGKTTVWRDAQEAGEALRRKRPSGNRAVRVLGADETVFGNKGREAVVGFGVDGQNGRTLGFEVLRYCRMLWIGFRSRGDLLLASFDQLSIHEPGSGPHQGDQPVAV